MEHRLMYGSRYGSYGTEDEINSLLEMIRHTEIKAKRRAKIEGYVDDLRGES